MTSQLSASARRQPLWTRVLFLLFSLLWPPVRESFVQAEEDDSETGLQISNGVEIAPHEFPWFSAILRAADDHFLCGGAFVGGSRYVLTARHCILDFNPLTELRVEVGYLCHQRKNCGRDSHRSAIKEWIVPQGGGDMAILVLKKAVKLPIVPVVPLLGPDVHPNQQTLSEGDQMTIVGGGMDENSGVSQKVEKLVVEFIPLEECRTMLSEPDRFIDPEFDICSNSVDGNPCKGDSGSALIIPGRGPYEGRDVMVAVHKFGPRRCQDPNTRVFGHFLLSSVSDLIRDEVCRGSNDAEDWCAPQSVVADGPNLEDLGWFTAILRDVSLDFICGGVLIGLRYVATASHCVGSTMVKVEVGYYCLDRGNCGRPNEVLSVSESRVPPGGGDMVLLILEKDVSINVEPAIPYLGSAIHPNQPELTKGVTTTMVAGGKVGTNEGLASVLKLLDMTYYAPKKCKKRVSPSSLVTDEVFCSIPQDENPCAGDGGSPLVVAGEGSLKGRSLVVGIHNFGPRDCNKSSYSGPVGHFRMSNAASLLQSVICDDDGSTSPDWCPPPPLQFEELGLFAAILDAADSRFLCSGVLIGARHVLTAHFCVEGRAIISIDAGYYCASRDNCGRPHETLGVLELHRHPSFEDLALIVLERAVSSEGIQPAVPYMGPSVHPNQSKPAKGLKMKLIAGGRDGSNSAEIATELKVLDMTFQPRNKCKKMLANPSFFQEHWFCTVPKDRTPCRGDSGGPLLVTGQGALRGRALVVGMHIAGSCGDGNGSPALHLEISKAATFLQSFVCDGPYPEDWC